MLDIRLHCEGGVSFTYAFDSFAEAIEFLEDEEGESR